MKILIDSKIDCVDCKLVESVDDNDEIIKTGLYTGHETITDFFKDNKHITIDELLTLLQFINEYMQEYYSNDMQDKYIVIGEKYYSFGYRGWGYIKYLAKIFNTKNIVDYMEGYINIDVESMIKIIDAKSENRQYITKQVGRYMIEYESDPFEKFGTISIYTERPKNYEVITINEFEIGIDENNLIVNVDMLVDKETFENITEKDIDKILEKCKAIVKAYLE